MRLGNQLENFADLAMDGPAACAQSQEGVRAASALSTPRLNFRISLDMLTDFQNRLREHREAKGITIEELAKQLDCSPSTISRLESGEMKMTDLWAPKLVEALGIVSVQLITGLNVVPKNEAEEDMLRAYQELDTESRAAIAHAIRALARKQDPLLPAPRKLLASPRKSRK